mmetsp:Transcript_40198/g.93437  ORF Transcript_40198/g.93437 Transcript_40198/m.93437 type:complete len:173 (-) Transcript_40198:133-651(-)
MHGQQPARPVLIYYHLPEDKDEVDIPNAFPVLKPGGGIRLQDVRAKFPLPGKYHFRFKTRLGDSSSALWMDMTSEDSQVPTFEGRIVAKVTRLSWDTQTSSPPIARTASVITSEAGSAAPQHPQRSPTAQAELLGFDDNTSATHPAAASPASNSRVSRPTQDRRDEFDMLFG